MALLVNRARGRGGDSVFTLKCRQVLNLIGKDQQRARLEANTGFIRDYQKDRQVVPKQP